MSNSRTFVSSAPRGHKPRGDICSWPIWPPQPRLRAVVLARTEARLAFISSILRRHEFPANRENNREFHHSTNSLTSEVTKIHGISSTGQGNLAVEQGIEDRRKERTSVRTKRDDGRGEAGRASHGRARAILMHHLHYLPNQWPLIGGPLLSLPVARPRSLPMEDD